jgi:hypothetical protein
VVERIFGPKKKKVTGLRRKLHNEELHNLYPSPNIVKVIKSRRMVGGKCEHVGDRKYEQNFSRKSQGKRPVWILEDNIEMKVHT